MPFTRNSQFVGREADLLAIAQALKAGQSAAIGEAAALTGMGGTAPECHRLTVYHPPVFSTSSQLFPIQVLDETRKRQCH